MNSLSTHYNNFMRKVGYGYGNGKKGNISISCTSKNDNICNYTYTGSNKNKHSINLSSHTENATPSEKISNMKFNMLIKSMNSKDIDLSQENKNNFQYGVKNTKIINLKSNHLISNVPFEVDASKLNASSISENAKNKLSELYNLNQSFNNLPSLNGIPKIGDVNKFKTNLSNKNYSNNLAAVPKININLVKGELNSYNGYDGLNGSKNHNSKLKNKKDEIFSMLTPNDRFINGGNIKTNKNAISVSESNFTPKNNKILSKISEIQNLTLTDDFNSFNLNTSISSKNNSNFFTKTKNQSAIEKMKNKFSK